jgi:hypothetical protein
MLCEYEPYREFVRNPTTQQPNNNTQNNMVKPPPMRPFSYLKIGKITKNLKDVLSKVALRKFLTLTYVQNVFEENFNKNAFKFTTALNDILYDFATQTNVFGGNGRETSFYEQFIEYFLERDDVDYEIFLDFPDYIRYLNRFVFVNNIMWICNDYCENFDGTATAWFFSNDYLLQQVLKFCK